MLVTSRRANRSIFREKTSHILIEKSVFLIEVVDEVPEGMKNCFTVYGLISNK